MSATIQLVLLALAVTGGGFAYFRHAGRRLDEKYNQPGSSAPDGQGAATEHQG